MASKACGWKINIPNFRFKATENQTNRGVHPDATYQLCPGPRIRWGGKLRAKTIFFTFGMDVRDIFKQQ